jgi:hypothetical protein
LDYVGPVIGGVRQHLGAVRRAVTMMSAGLSDPRMQIEIQVTAAQAHPMTRLTRNIAGLHAGSNYTLPMIRRGRGRASVNTPSGQIL